MSQRAGGRAGTTRVDGAIIVVRRVSHEEAFPCLEFPPETARGKTLMHRSPWHDFSDDLTYSWPIQPESIHGGCRSNAVTCYHTCRETRRDRPALQREELTARRPCRAAGLSPSDPSHSCLPARPPLLQQRCRFQQRPARLLSAMPVRQDSIYAICPRCTKSSKLLSELPTVTFHKSSRHLTEIL